MKILIVEDDKVISHFIAKGLREEGNVVSQAADGRAGLEKATTGDFDFIVLDVMLPKMDGFEVCRQVRKSGSKIPIIMLTAKDAVESRIQGLDAGADDYLVKPFAFSELIARIRAVGRRKDGESQTFLEANGLQVDQVRHKVIYDGREMDLTSREFSLLQHFMKRRGHALSRTIIIESVWGYDFQGGTNIIDVYINILRRKLRKLTGKDWIRTIRNRGYVFEGAAS